MKLKICLSVCSAYTNSFVWEAMPRASQLDLVGANLEDGIKRCLTVVGL